jgi:sulfotransferase family protein
MYLLPVLATVPTIVGVAGLTRPASRRGVQRAKAHSPKGWFEVKVIGAGFGRTGTASLKAALETLGFDPCYHMIEVFKHPGHAGFWQAAWREEPVDWDGLLGAYEATVDWPACTFYAELMNRYPDAKVLLSVRDPERWYQSTRNTIYQLGRVSSGSPLSRLSFALFFLLAFGTFKAGQGSMTEEIVWRGTFDGKFEDKHHAIEVFNRHNEEVRRRVPKDRLLVYEVKEGWGPLCEFLGVEEPDKPFPHLNDAAEMRRRILVLRAFFLAVPAILMILLSIVLALLRRRALQ